VIDIFLEQRYLFATIVLRDENQSFRYFINIRAIFDIVRVAFLLYRS